jgi:hypothetical protein
MNVHTAKEGELTVLALVTGQYILGRVTERTDDYLALKTVVGFVCQPHQPEGSKDIHLQIQFMPYFAHGVEFHIDVATPFKSLHVMHELEPSKPLHDAYVKATTRIQIAQSMPPAQARRIVPG